MDRDARARFVETHARRVYGAIARTLRELGLPNDEETLEDRFAAVFVALFEDEARRLVQWDGRCSIETWLSIVAGSVTRDWARSERRREARLVRGVDPELASGERAGPWPLDDVSPDGGEMARLELALGALSPADRSLIEALFIEERPAGAVAAELGTTLGALYTRKSRALERLRDAFARGEGR